MDSSHTAATDHETTPQPGADGPLLPASALLDILRLGNRRELSQVIPRLLAHLNCQQARWVTSHPHIDTSPQIDESSSGLQVIWPLGSDMGNLEFMFPGSPSALQQQWPALNQLAELLEQRLTQLQALPSRQPAEEAAHE